MSISQEIIEKIRDRVSACEIISEYTALNQRGRQFMGLCPFHEEKTPSFSVSEENGLFYCFGCGKKGTVLDFVMEKRGLTFPETLRYLGSRYGIEVPESEASSENDISRRKLEKERRAVLLSAVELVTECYCQFLANAPEAEVARDYLSERKISLETAKLFRLGYAPDDWQFLVSRLEDITKKTRVHRGLEGSGLQDSLKHLGIIADKKNGGHYDIFRGRVIFPIMRSDGAPMALGGRILHSKSIAAESTTGPKYLNSRESEIYSKRKTFYGMNVALSEVSRSRQAYIVEGYLDTISMYQAGVKNVLATCGTAITMEHFDVLRRVTDRVVVVFDGDSAGKKAAAGVFGFALNSGVEVMVARLPDGHDPDSLARDRGVAYLKEGLKNTRPAFLEYIEYLLMQDIGSEECQTERLLPAVSAKISTKVAELIVQVSNPVERDVLIMLAAERLGVTRSAMGHVVARVSTAKRAQSNSNYVVNPATRPDGSERLKSFNKNPGRVEDDFDASWGNTEIRKDVRVVPGSKRALNESRSLAVQPEYALVCALLRKPYLARKITSDPDLLSLQEILPSNVWGFVVALAEGDYIGIDEEELPEGFLEFCRNSDTVRKLAYLLKIYFMPVGQLLKESFLHRKIGGNSPELVFKDIVGGLYIKKLKGEISVLSSTCDTDSDLAVIRIAQEKLMKRKQIEGLRDK